MISVDGLLIFTNVYSILKKLQHDLHILGIPLLAEIKPPREYQDIIITCPYHKNGQEYKPAGAVTTIPKHNVEAGTFYCFSCKKTATLPEMISHCFGRHDGGAYGKQWLCDNFSSSGDRSKAFEIPTRSTTINNIKYVDDKELESYRFIHPYLYKRGMTDELIEKFDLGYDKLTQTVTFPIKDTNGKVLFVPKRSVHTKHFLLPKDLVKPVCYLYEAMQEQSNTLYVCESLFNALTMWKFSLPAVALLGTGTSHQLEKLKFTPFRKLVICLDNDLAGDKGRDKIKSNLSGYKLLEFATTPKGTDINDYAHCKNKNEFFSKIGIDK